MPQPAGSTREKAKRSPSNHPTQYLLAPRVFLAVQKLCQEALRMSGNHRYVREAITDLFLRMKGEAVLEWGYTSTDALAIHQLLRRTNEKETQHDRAISRDPIKLMETQGRLSLDQIAAANMIQTIWRAFGRYLVMSARKYEGGGGGNKSGRALQPMDVMSQHVYDNWKSFYIPWFTKASACTVPCGIGIKLSAARIVLEVVVENYSPDQLDKAYRLDRGKALAILRRWLRQFANPSLEGNHEHHDQAINNPAGSERSARPSQSPQDPAEVARRIRL